MQEIIRILSDGWATNALLACAFAASWIVILALLRSLSFLGDFFLLRLPIIYRLQSWRKSQKIDELKTDVISGKSYSCQAAQEGLAVISEFCNAMDKRLSHISGRRSLFIAMLGRPRVSDSVDNLMKRYMALLEEDYAVLSFCSNDSRKRMVGLLNLAGNSNVEDSVKRALMLRALAAQDDDLRWIALSNIGAVVDNERQLRQISHIVDTWPESMSTKGKTFVEEMSRGIMESGGFAVRGSGR